MGSLRKWQKDFLNVFADHDRQAFLLVAAVGSGKTRAGVAAGEMWMARQERNPLCIIVSPSLQILRGWARTIGKGHGKIGVASLDPRERVLQTDDGKIELLSVNVTPPKDLRYWLCTYGSLLGLAGIFGSVCRHRDVFVILDEPHHAESGDDPSAWGRAVQQAFGDAGRILCVTATPYRTRGTAIPFLAYGEDGRAVPDFVCSRERAIREKYIRKLRFLRMDAEVGWTFIETGTSAESAISGDQADMALRSAIKDDDFIVEMLERTKYELDQRRREGFDGTMLVLADNVAYDHARRIDEIANELWPGFSVRATGDDPNAHATIDLFRERRLDARCLVTVGMAGEGCDIPHLVALCWLTTRRTQLFFTQATGRPVRRTNGEPDGIVATVVLPNHPELARLAAELLSEEIPPLREVDTAGERESGERDDSPAFMEVTVEDIRAGYLTEEDESILVTREIDALARRYRLPVDVVRAIREGQPPPATDDDTARAVSLRKQIQRRISQIAYRGRRPGENDADMHKRVWLEAKSRSGLGSSRTYESCSTQELERLDSVTLAMLREVA